MTIYIDTASEKIVVKVGRDATPYKNIGMQYCNHDNLYRYMLKKQKLNKFLGESNAIPNTNIGIATMIIYIDTC